MLGDSFDKAVMLRRVLNFQCISIEASNLLAVFLPVFVQMFADVECGSGLVSVMSLLIFVRVCNVMHVPKCLMKCLEVYRRCFAPSTCFIQISCWNIECNYAKDCRNGSWKRVPKKKELDSGTGRFYFKIFRVHKFHWDVTWTSVTGFVFVFVGAVDRRLMFVLVLFRSWDVWLEHKYFQISDGPKTKWYRENRSSVWIDHVLCYVL